MNLWSRQKPRELTPPERKLDDRRVLSFEDDCDTHSVGVSKWYGRVHGLEVTANYEKGLSPRERKRRLAEEERTKAARKAAKAAAEKAFKEAERKETDRDVVEKAAHAHLGDGDHSDGVDYGKEENHRAFVAEYIRTYMCAVRAAAEAARRGDFIIGSDGILRFGGKRKRRRTRRKKIKQEKKH